MKGKEVKIFFNRCVLAGLKRGEMVSRAVMEKPLNPSLMLRGVQTVALLENNLVEAVQTQRIDAITLDLVADRFINDRVSNR